MHTLFPEKDKLSVFLEMYKPVIYTADNNLGKTVFNLVHVGIDPLPFLTENLISVRVICCFNRSIEKVSGILL